jgi:hypothetical protein
METVMATKMAITKRWITKFSISPQPFLLSAQCVAPGPGPTGNCRKRGAFYDPIAIILSLEMRRT